MLLLLQVFRFNTWAESHFDLDKRFITISQKIFGFSVVDPHHTQEKMARCTQSHFHLFSGGRKNRITICMNTHHTKANNKQQKDERHTFGEMMLSTLLSRLHSKTCALVSFLSQWAASQILASGPRLLRTKWA